MSCVVFNSSTGSSLQAGTSFRYWVFLNLFWNIPTAFFIYDIDILEEVSSFFLPAFLEAMFYIWGFSDVSWWLNTGYSFQAGDST